MKEIMQRNVIDFKRDHRSNKNVLTDIIKNTIFYRKSLFEILKIIENDEKDSLRECLIFLVSLI
jgi:hypothetical protein